MTVSFIGGENHQPSAKALTNFITYEVDLASRHTGFHSDWREGNFVKTTVSYFYRVDCTVVYVEVLNMKTIPTIVVGNVEL